MVNAIHICENIVPFDDIFIILFPIQCVGILKQSDKKHVIVQIFVNLAVYPCRQCWQKLRPLSKMSPESDFY